MSAIEILNIWIDHAYKTGQSEHKRAFWYARDIVEGKLNIPEKYKVEAIDFIRTQCKDSDNKKIVMEALRI